jgi:RNA polymerase sigma factor (sigma-70 family)
MLAIARAYFASEADAEDAVQDAVLKAFRALGQFADGTNFGAWFARITINTCLNVLRARTDKLSLPDFASTVQFRPRLGPARLQPSVALAPLRRATWCHPHEERTTSVAGQSTKAQVVG